MKHLGSVGEIRILVRLGDKSLSPRRRNDIRLFSSLVSRFSRELVEDLGIPAKVELSVKPPMPDASLLVTINDEPCRMKRQFSNGGLTAKKLAVEIANVILQNREKLLDSVLAAGIADSIRGQRKAQEGFYLAGLSRADFHDYLRLLLRRFFRIHRGAHLNGPVVRTLKQRDSPDCFEEAVRSPRNLSLTLFRSAGSTGEPLDERDKSIDEALSDMREARSYELGIRVPQIQLREDAFLRRNEIRLQINDVRQPPTQTLGIHEFLVTDTVDHLLQQNIQSRKAVHPTKGTECAIMRGNGRGGEALKQVNLKTWGRNEYSALIVGEELHNFAGCFIVSGTVEFELDQLKAETPALIDMVRERFELNSIVRLLRYLADEGISNRHLRGILEALVTTSTTSGVDFGKYRVLNPYEMSLTPVLKSTENEGPEVRTYGEAIRSSLHRYIFHKHTQGQGALVAYLLDPKIESLLKESFERSLTENEREGILKALEMEVRDLPASAQNPVILTSIDVRRTLRDLIAIEFPKLAVLSYQELPPDLSIQSIGKICLPIN